MQLLAVDPPWDAECWRMQARKALQAGWAPEALSWQGHAQVGLDFSAASAEAREAPASRSVPRVPRSFLDLAEAVLCHRDPQRFGLLYRLLWRIAEGQPGLLERASDPDVHRARELEKAVRRDTHKMKAFVRFRGIAGEQDNFVAWFEPEHLIVDRVAPFFARRFAGMRWAILTPYRSARWDGTTLSFGEGTARDAAPADDAQEDLWRTYYANIFNPARLNPRMMRQEMPQKYWGLLPETRLLPELIRGAGQRVHEMAERAPQPTRRKLPVAAPAPALPAHDSLQHLEQAITQCRRCPLWQPATQAVCGEGPEAARVVIVGEQPGDMEDLSGRPFVGPAGKLFNEVLGRLGLDRGGMSVTNAVKHFRFEQRGKRRLHRNPERAHVQACGPWLARELALVKPQVVVALGGTAAQALFGSGFRLGEHRGQWLRLAGGTRALATYHPSAVLRQPPATRESWLQAFEHDLAMLRDALAAPRE